MQKTRRSAGEAPRFFMPFSDFFFGFSLDGRGKIGEQHRRQDQSRADDQVVGQFILAERYGCDGGNNGREGAGDGDYGGIRMHGCHVFQHPAKADGNKTEQGKQGQKLEIEGEVDRLGRGAVQHQGVQCERADERDQKVNAHMNDHIKGHIQALGVDTCQRDARTEDQARHSAKQVAEGQRNAACRADAAKDEATTHAKHRCNDLGERGTLFDQKEQCDRHHRTGKMLQKRVVRRRRVLQADLLQKARHRVQCTDGCCDLEIAGGKLVQTLGVHRKQKHKGNARADGGQYRGGIVIVKAGHDDGIKAPDENNEKQRDIIRPFADEYQLFQGEPPLCFCN